MAFKAFHVLPPHDSWLSLLVPISTHSIPPTVVLGSVPAYRLLSKPLAFCSDICCHLVVEIHLFTLFVQHYFSGFCLSVTPYPIMIFVCLFVCLVAIIS